MRMLVFARRNTKEMLRDPLTLAFGAGFPVVLLLLLSLIQRNVPVELFAIEKLTPGITVFGQTFLALFAALLISRDRSSALMMRLLTSPLRARDFILGYALPLLPMAAAQGLVCCLFALPLGLACSARLLLCLAVQLPSALLFVALGLICGSVLNDRQVGGICGAVLTNVCAWLSGVWFDLELMGGGLAKFARCLPFANAVEAGRAAIAGDFAAMLPPFAIACAWSVALSLLAIRVFSMKMRSA